MKTAAKLVFKKCFGLKEDERVLIVTDENKRNIANTFFHAARETTDNVGLVEMPVMERNGQEPPKDIASHMKNADVVLLITTKSLTHTKARKDACSKGARIASMPGITEGMVNALMADYDNMKILTEKLGSKLDRARHVMIKNDKGTDIMLSLKDRRVEFDNGDFTEKGAFGNLPAGEASISPAENSASGLLVTDLSIGGIGKVSGPVKIFIENGFITEIKGGEESKQLAKLLADVKSELAYNIAELGIGTNDKAKICGSVLEDEKVVGTAHIGIGNNTSYGGKIDVPVHIDCVFSKPTIVVDGKRIMEDGEFLLEGQKGIWWKTK